MNNVNELHEAMARVVVADRQLAGVLNEITGITRRAMPSIEAASVTLIRGETAFTAAYDGQMAPDADKLQYERGYGPCVDAGRAGQVPLIDDMRSEQRWPDYAQHAVAQGVLSALSVPRPFQGATIGALNTYAGRPQIMDDEDLELAEEVAGWVAIAIGNAEAAARTSEDHSSAHRDDVSRLDRTGKRHSDGAAQGHRGRGIHHPHPRVPTNKHEAAGRGGRTRPDRRTASSG
jgi:GAF domain-containing protein